MSWLGALAALALTQPAAASDWRRFEVPGTRLALDVPQAPRVLTNDDVRRRGDAANLVGEGDTLRTVIEFFSGRAWWRGVLVVTQPKLQPNRTLLGMAAYGSFQALLDAASEGRTTHYRLGRIGAAWMADLRAEYSESRLLEPFVLRQAFIWGDEWMATLMLWSFPSDAIGEVEVDRMFASIRLDGKAPAEMLDEKPPVRRAGAAR